MQIASPKTPKQASLDERERVHWRLPTPAPGSQGGGACYCNIQPKVITVYGEDDGTTEEETWASMRANGFLNRAKELAKMAEG